MIKPINIPRGVANLFSIDMSTDIYIPEMWNKRPDKILDYIGQKSMYGEIVNNYMSNTSPISCTKTDVYKVCDSTFRGYFGNA